ncbi:MAG TPA: RND transporter, partial [Pseudorhodoferax sp.]|nr:RND transporter [Pseudorhodoferax sp.]
MPRRSVLLALPVLLAGCAVGPRYERPDTAFAAAFKEAPAAEGWVPAQPGDALERGDWWTRFGDAQLDALAER